MVYPLTERGIVPASRSIIINVRSLVHSFLDMRYVQPLTSMNPPSLVFMTGTHSTFTPNCWRVMSISSIRQNVSTVGFEPTPVGILSPLPLPIGLRGHGLMSYYDLIVV